MERLMLLDGNGLIYRGYFALPPLSTSKGELVNAVFGFCSIVLRGIQDIRPDYVAVAFDLPGPTFRHERFAEYKATRTRMPDDLRDQFPKVREVVRALRLPVYELAGFEADDVIGTLTVEAEARGLDTTVVTGDLDMLQIVSDHVRLMTTRSGVENTILYDPAKIYERYGLLPSQMIDYKALKGDVTDNIPGVPGVGEKTAARLIREFGNLDTVYARLDEVKPEKLRDKLSEFRDQVDLGKELSTILRDLPVTLDLEAARLGEYDRDEVIRLFREYEFRSLLDRLPAISGETPAAAADALRAANATVPAARVGTERPSGWGSGRPIRPSPAVTAPPAGLQLSLDFDIAGGAQGTGMDRAPRPTEQFDDLATALAATIADPARIEVHTGDGLDALRAWIAQQPMVGAALVKDDPRPRAGSTLAVALAGTDGRVVAAEGEDGDRLRGLLEASGVPIVAHEAKPLLVARFGTDAEGPATPVAFDTQIAAYLLNAALRSQTIADVVAERLDLVLPPAKELTAVDRAGLEALSALAAREPLATALRDEGLEQLFVDMELPLVSVLARMEAIGVAVDLEALALLDREFGAEITRLEQTIFDAVGHQFTIGSPKQLGDVLFGELQLPKGRKTKTGYSTDASVLEGLVDVHPVVQPVLDWRTYTKLRSTYVEALPALLADDGRVHTTFHQAVAATGRLSSSDPNLQNIPIRTPLGRRIRRAFVAGGPDVVLVAADYSQIKLRILAHVSGDEHLRAAFARQADIHRETAARVLHKEPGDVTSDERSMAKMVNFGLAYGMSDFGLSSRAGISRQEAQEFINSYFAAYSGISYYMLHIKETARRDGFVQTLLGRRRQIPELRAANPSLRGAGERMAINMPIQGTAADIVKIAMIRLDRRIRDEGFRARPLLQVHDELLLEVPRDEVERLIPVLREVMEHALPLDVPLTVDVKVGDDWESMTPVTRVDAVLAEAGEARGADVPELPEVETVARDLRGLVVGAEIIGATSLWHGTLRTHDPDAIGPALAGRRIESVGRRGKQLVLVLSSGAVLTVHLKMTGQLFVVPRAAPLDPYVRLVVAFADGRDLRFRDIRKFGKIGLYAVDPGTGEPVRELGGSAVFAGTGPEPLDEAFTLRAFRARLRGRRGRLKSLLLDQAFVAGIGNIYADEALWAARLHPLRSASTLGPADERRLYVEFRRILAEAIIRRGSSIDDYTAPEGDGSMQEHVMAYQRAGQPCPRCGRPVRRIVVGSRATHFCSWCQRLPAVDRKGAAAILRTMTPRSGANPGRRGRRWTELDGDDLGRTAGERAAAAAEAVARADRTRRAATKRRTAARATTGDA